MALGGVGYYSIGYWNNHYWHIDYWYGIDIIPTSEEHCGSMFLHLCIKMCWILWIIKEINDKTIFD